MGFDDIINKIGSSQIKKVYNIQVFDLKTNKYGYMVLSEQQYEKMKDSARKISHAQEVRNDRKKKLRQIWK